MAYQHDWRSKIVMDPICEIIDIGPVQAVTDTPEFQLLSDKKQLSLTYLVFRSAVHTRLAHSLGAYHRTIDLADQWMRRGYVGQRERDALVMFALVHDVGHAAFSHATEGFLGMDHDAWTAHLIDTTLRPAIGSCDVDADLVLAFARHENPLYLGVHDKNLGTEKLDYLERDGFFTIGSRPAGVRYLRNYIYFIDGVLAIDEKVVQQALNAQLFYMEMFKGVYFRKSLVIAQRMFHKAVRHCILEEELTGKALVTMTDSELIGKLASSASQTTQLLYRRIRERRLFREAIAVRPERFVHETRVADKPIAVLGVDQTTMDALVRLPDLQQDNHARLEDIETSIAELTGLADQEVLVVPVFNPERFHAKDITVFGSDRQLHSVKERRPQHFASLDEVARSYSALRICTTEQARHHLSHPRMAQRVLDLVLSLTS